jgi:large subunit ribosomal protein L5
MAEKKPKEKQPEKAAEKKSKEKQPEKAAEKKSKEKQPEKSSAIPVDYQPRLIAAYQNDVVPKLRKRFDYKNIMQVPKLEKIVLNFGVGDATENTKAVDTALEEMTKIAGQKPIIRRAKKAISNFKLREGMPIGCSVTLRSWTMYEFLDRLIAVAIPRVRDFRGLPNKFDGRGNYNISVKEQIVFPEIDYDKVDKVRGMNITIVTTAKTDEEAYELLVAFGMPFVKKS